MTRYLLLFLSTVLFLFSCAEKQNVPFQSGLEHYPVLKKVLEDSSKYQVQILYTQIDRNEHANPLMTVFKFNLDDERYFYPASTVKLPVVLLALEWLEEQNLEGLDAETIMLTDSARPSQFSALVDSSSQSGHPSIGHYIKKILLVSDNDAFNRLYELLGQDYINRKLSEKGLNHTVINHRLSMPMSPEENRHFNPIRFVDKSGNVILQIPARSTETVFSNTNQPKIGKAYYSGDSLIPEPLDFTFKNKFSISDFDGVLKRIVFPQAFLGDERFEISEEHRNFVLKYMSMLPRESDFPSYPQEEYTDSYSKFFKFGTDKNPIPAQFRIFNKTGWAYGHLIDGSYFVDFENGVEFFVTAVIYTNENEILNDDTYETEEIGLPFFAELGEYLYQRELKRKKQIPADLSGFRFEY
ncbi:serine hydrolase [Algoriphagus boritolerans]|uniref:Beta-lactamase enzyme family protein n=1 Tax=Algoriphagus boritolerans DSM 17298 = JCM 18970 TaxID=1120964 RepID=A0A1H5YBH4_9BACT|nr:serine hydrolase [Algoriphagus boritolerans]SEG21393.1 Beta-lactamase enzyme family protein [Algoriphagus boritolerans DSM 17298 = JCM 18970]